MKATAYVGTAALSLLATWAAAVQPPSVVKQASAIEWTKANVAALTAMFPDKKAVAVLEHETLPVDDRDSEDVYPNQIGEFKIVDLNNDGQLELLCTVDASGRAFYTDLVVFSNKNGKLVRDDVSTDGANMEHLASSIGDLRHDGKQEILVPWMLGDYVGGDPVAYLPNIYKFSEGRLVKVSYMFSSYYMSTLLPHLKAQYQTYYAQPDEQKWLPVLRQEINTLEYAFGK